VIRDNGNWIIKFTFQYGSTQMIDGTNASCWLDKFTFQYGSTQMNI